MASTNIINLAQCPQAPSWLCCDLPRSELEKISCSVPGKTYLSASQVLGRHIVVSEAIGSETVSYGCTVLGYLSCAPGLGVSPQLFLRHDGIDPRFSDEHVDLSALTILSID